MKQSVTRMVSSDRRFLFGKPRAVGTVCAVSSPTRAALTQSIRRIHGWKAVRITVAIALALAWAGVEARAATFTWGGGDKKTSDWTKKGNWTGDAAPADNSTNAYIFQGSTRTDPNNDRSGITATGITFASGASAFTLGGNDITLQGIVSNSSSNLQTINLNLILGTSGTFNAASGDILVGGTISGTNALAKTGTNDLTFSAANTYSGATTISAGSINIQNALALGGTAGSTTVSSGAALQLQNNITVAGEALSLSGSGVNNDGALRNISGTNTYAGVVTLGSSSRINSDAGLLTLSTGTITGSGFGLSVGGVGDTTISSIIGTGTGSLTKDGAGTLTLTAANTYTGATTVTAGELNIQNSLALGGTSAGTTVAAGGALQLQNGITVSG